MELKKLIFIPILLFAISSAILMTNYFRTGDFILKDIDLKGGTLISIESSQPINTKLLDQQLSEKYGSVLISGLRTTGGYGANIEVSEEVNADDVLNDIKTLGIDISSYSVETIGPALGTLFYEQMRRVLIVGFILMSVVIFFIYRNPLSSFGIVFAALANILTALALTSLIGVKVSFAGLAALLMLIAYSVDTNIVLTNKVLRSTPENFKKQYKKALITGVTLTVSITMTMIVVLFLSNSKLLINIAQVLVFGFLADLIYTWIFNSSLLEMWVMRRYK